VTERRDAIDKLAQKTTHELIQMLLDEACLVRYTPGYINGDDYSEWYADMGHGLPRVIGALAVKHGRHEELVDRMEILSGPICAEMLMNNTSMCAEAVPKWNDVCDKHHYRNAAEHGWCRSPSHKAPRACRDTPVSVLGRCKGHMRFCPVVKVNGELCDRYDCKVKAHQSKQDSLLE
jgi:hypothetical protein